MASVHPWSALAGALSGVWDCVGGAPGNSEPQLAGAKRDGGSMGEGIGGEAIVGPTEGTRFIEIGTWVCGSPTPGSASVRTPPSPQKQ